LGLEFLAAGSDVRRQVVVGGDVKRRGVVVGLVETEALRRGCSRGRWAV
jgi:hypothetical protein